MAILAAVMSNRWLPEEDHLLRSLHGLSSFSEIGQRLGRSRGSIAHRASALGLKLTIDAYTGRCRIGGRSRRGKSKYPTQAAKLAAQRAQRRQYEATPSARERKNRWARAWKAKNYLKHLLRVAKKRAKDKGIEFTITEADVIVHDVCPILDVKITAPGTWHGPSLDRRDNALGYVPGNVHVVSKRGNTWKGDATPSDLRRILDYLEGRA